MPAKLHKMDGAQSGTNTDKAVLVRGQPIAWTKLFELMVSFLVPEMNLSHASWQPRTQIIRHRENVLNRLPYRDIAMSTFNHFRTRPNKNIQNMEALTGVLYLADTVYLIPRNAVSRVQQWRQSAYPSGMTGCHFRATQTRR